MECGLGEERHWGKLWLIPALIFGIGIFSTFFVTSSNLTASQVVAGAFGIEIINLGSFKVEGVIVMGVLLCILTYVVTMAANTPGTRLMLMMIMPIPIKI